MGIKKYEKMDGRRQSTQAICDTLLAYGQQSRRYTEKKSSGTDLGGDTQ